jgi:hypothetical protein
MRNQCLEQRGIRCLACVEIRRHDQIILTG